MMTTTSYRIRLTSPVEREGHRPAVLYAAYKDTTWGFVRSADKARLKNEKAAMRAARALPLIKSMVEKGWHVEVVKLEEEILYES